jgi:hypothetical protein
MKTKINLFLLFIFVSFLASAQKFNPTETEKSLVRIEIKQGNKGYASSGFIWKDPSTVVTSLHAMKQGATYKVFYNNKFPRDAQVYKVFKEADLVLLKTNIDEKPLTSEVKPITGYSSTRPEFGDKLYAQGFHGGSKGHRTTPLEKNAANPETLKMLVWESDKRQTLLDLGFPSIDLDIVYLVGSLLPGYSGSPIYNMKGELVAIGNGGLENGATGVSWAIPASYLEKLDNSTVSSLPSNLNQIDLLMSSQVEVEIDPNDNSDDAVQRKMEEQYAVYEGGSFEFVKTKNRSFDEMYNSSFETENLDFFIENLEDNNLQVDYEFIRFDLYEDLNNGVTIAVPEESQLVYLPESGSFTVDISNYGLSEYFSLEYYGYTDTNYEIADVDEAANLLLDQIDLSIGEAYGGFYEDEDFSFSLELGPDAEVVYILYHSNNTKYEEYDDDYHAMRIYFTVLRKGNQYFYTMCSISLPTEKMTEVIDSGVDCVNNYEGYPEACEFFEGFIRVQAAAQFTTFSGTMLTRN